MPFTPYHFGPNGFVGLAFRKYLDIPVLLLVNIAVDLEVLIIRALGVGWPYHRYTHTLLLGAVVGAATAVAAYPFRNILKKVMRVFRLSYRPTFPKMLLSGVLGVWLHIVIDAVHQYDVHLFWPYKARPLWNLLSQSYVKAVCLAFFAAAVIIYAIAVRSYLRQHKPTKPKSDT